MKNFLLVMFSIFFGLSLFEIASNEYIKNKKEAVEVLLPEKARIFYQNYYRALHHLRGFVPYRGVIPAWNLKATASNAMFTTIRDFNKSHANVLIQGDSWGAQFILNRNSKDVLMEIASRDNIGLVVAGTSSYSFSPMEVQLRILRSDFDLKPTHLITVVDHTDIGDELCRYMNLVELNDSGHPIRVNPESYLSKEDFSIKHFFDRNTIIYSSKFNIVKLIELGIIEISRKFFSGKERCEWEEIARPLIKGLSVNEEKYFRERMGSYIDSAFKDKSLLKLTFVIHPHLKHLEESVANSYKLYLAEIMKGVIQSSAHKEKIHLMDFKNMISDVYFKEGFNSNPSIFVENDPASHLNDKAHSIYSKYILNHLDN